MLELSVGGSFRDSCQCETLGEVGKFLFIEGQSDMLGAAAKVEVHCIIIEDLEEVGLFLVQVSAIVDKAKVWAWG